VTLAYVFWHQPRDGVDPGEYEAGMRGFHRRLAAVPVPGFVDSWTLRVPDLPWLTGGGYEDWYLVDDFAALGTLAEHAVDRARIESHDVVAYASRHGAGAVYALLAGDSGATASVGGESGGTDRSGWVGWFSKRDDVRYPRLRADLVRSIEDGAIRAVWQRQLVLGPAPEFRVLGAGPIAVGGADLTVGVPVVVSG
jgi:hypothetical protein